MSVSRSTRLVLPDSLRLKLTQFRQRVWWIKSIEAISLASCGIVLGFLAVYLLDRVWDTPSYPRTMILGLAAVICGVLPWAAYRWVWRNRRLEQLAMLLRKKHPAIGDQLLGIIELVNNDAEQARSRELCEAAVKQVSQVADRRDLRDAVPRPRHRLYGGIAMGVSVVALLLSVLAPAAATNALARYLLPWRDTPRYTFTKIEPLGHTKVVAHGEPFAIELRLQDETVWRPAKAGIKLDGRDKLEANERSGAYAFDCPGLLEPAAMSVYAGDYIQRVQLDPQLRPELTSVTAHVRLPDYLERPEPFEKDLRGGSGAIVHGSRVQVTAKASRELARASVNDQPVTPHGAEVVSATHEVTEDMKLAIAWEDTMGLAGQRPFVLNLQSRQDEAPAVVCEGIARRQVVLDSEMLTFNVRGLDDFGIKRVGMEWEGADEIPGLASDKGERILGAGGPMAEEVQLTGTFSAKSLNIEPQAIYLRIFVEDYLPGRERVYSPPYLLYVLTPEQHAIWITDQLSKWHRNSLEVRDREMQLYETNRQLQELSANELDEPETRRDIEQQAMAERTNGRRLSRLTEIGDELVKQASRNDEIGVGHLEKWAEMLQVLKDISANRMPSVAGLLADASKAEALAQAKPSESQPAGPQAGQDLNTLPPAAGGEGEGDENKRPPVPSLSDVESSQQPAGENSPSPPSDSKPSSPPRFGLPTTTLVGGGPKPDACPAGQQMDQAVTEQRDLLAEFEKVADELNEILANLEGSTLVKRLKATSRDEYKIAGGLGQKVDVTFGRGAPTEGQLTSTLDELVEKQLATGQTVSYIMDDMQAYYERRRMAKFKSVLDEMRAEDVLGGLRGLSDELRSENGLAMAQCEFWSDTLDRWAEDLVDPAGGGT